MPMPNELYHRDIMGNVEESWKMFMESMNQSLDMLEKDIEEVAQMQDACTSEWCEATEHVLDELSNSVFSISEPRWAPKEMSDKIKELKKRTHDLYSRYKSASSQ